MKKRITSLVLLLALCIGVAHAYPTGPVTIVVPFPAGQTGDIIARTLAVELAKKYGKPFVIDNRPGAGGQIGTTYAARAKNDGSVLLMTSSGPFAIAPVLYPGTLPYQPLRDFSVIVEAATTPQILAVSNDSGIKNVDELVKAAKAKEITYASAGNGSTQHLSMELLKQQLGIQMLHIPFKGSAPAFTDLMAGHVQFMAESVPQAANYAKQGKVKALAVTSAKRNPALPNVPTVIETGVANLEVVGFYGILAPKGTPPEVANQLSHAFKETLESPDIQKKMIDQGADPAYLNPDQFTKYLAAEMPKWAKAVKQAGAKLD